MQIDVSITPGDIQAELSADIEKVTDRFFQSLKSELAPAAREVIDSSSPAGRLYARTRGEGFTRSHKASAQGQPPAKDSFELYNSFRAEKSGSRQVTFSMAGHARYLDPVFGGYLNRPFLGETVKIAVSNTLAKDL